MDLDGIVTGMPICATEVLIVNNEHGGAEAVYSISSTDLNH